MSVLERKKTKKAKEWNNCYVGKESLTSNRNDGFLESVYVLLGYIKATTPSCQNLLEETSN